MPTDGRFGQADRQAVQDAGGVEEALDGVVGWCFERFGDLLVDHEVYGVGLPEAPHGAECLLGSGEIVDHFEGEHDVVAVGPDPRRQVARHVDQLEPHPLADPGLGGVLAGGGDRCLVVVEPVDLDLRPGACDGDRGPALAASDLGDSCRTGGQTIGDAGHGRQPIRCQQVEERGPVEVALRVVDRVVGIRDPVAGAERVDKRGEHTADRGKQVQQGSDRSQALGAQQALLCGRREPVASLVGIVGVRLQDDEPCGSLLLEPLPGVAGMDPGIVGQPERRRAVARSQVLVQPELSAQADRDGFESGETGLDETFGVGTDLGLEVLIAGFGTGHGTASCGLDVSFTMQALHRLWRCQNAPLHLPDGHDFWFVDTVRAGAYGVAEVTGEGGMFLFDAADRHADAPCDGLTGPLDRVAGTPGT
ncbi:MAG: hypothetical protein H0U21_07745, partial [Acidimicrobiia bacterium]|nr:hypothetical protein [Acidimicrobiia bacterium]